MLTLPARHLRAGHVLYHPEGCREIESATDLDAHTYYFRFHDGRVMTSPAGREFPVVGVMVRGGRVMFP